MNRNQHSRTLHVFLSITLGVALVLSIFLLMQRVAAEKQYNKLEIALNSSELYSLASANEMTIEELASKIQERGVTSVLLKEISLGELKRIGDIGFYQGREIERTSFVTKAAPDIPLDDSYFLIAVHNKEIEKQLSAHLSIKIPGSAYYPGEVGTYAIPINIPNSETEKNEILEQLSGIGVGFLPEQIAELSSNGFEILPQIRDWHGADEESLSYVCEELRKIPELKTVLFNDKNIPGNPENLEFLARELERTLGDKISLGIVEFFEQKGSKRLSLELNKRVTRMHAISKEEMPNYNPVRATDRFVLAARERNIRILFVRLFDMENPSLALDKNLNYLEGLNQRILANGLEPGPAEQFSSPLYSRIIVFIIGAGTIALYALTLSRLGLKRTAKIFFAVSIITWPALLFAKPLLARKLMALAAVIISPVYAFLHVASDKPQKLPAACLGFVKLSLWSMSGAVLMGGLLADKLFMLKIDQFSGVKLAHLIPLILIVVAVLWQQGIKYRELNELADSFVRYRHVIAGGAFMLVLLVYVLRTGNDAQSLVFGFESKMRTLLDVLLGVRPRTKEFLIGHPVTLALLYFGFKKDYWWLMIIAGIGQLSLINTYAHVHTPLLVSVQRSINGVVLGLILGIVLIYLLKLIKIGSDKLKSKQ